MHIVCVHMVICWTLCSAFQMLMSKVGTAFSRDLSRVESRESVRESTK